MRFGPSVLALTALFKVMRVGGSYLAAFMAAKIHQEKYIDLVFMKKGDPPPLAGMLSTFMMLHLLFAAVSFGVVCALVYLMAGDASRAAPGVAFTHSMYTKLAMLGALDLGCEVIATLMMGMVIASVITNKKYFSYKYEGLRAIRAYREILVVVSAINGLTPYFLAAPDSWR